VKHPFKYTCNFPISDQKSEQLRNPSAQQALRGNIQQEKPRGNHNAIATKQT
jgi:hypothetical protein